jgi:uncharacterized protein (TIGR02266 family)
MGELDQSTDSARRKHPRARLTFLVQYRYKDFESFAREWGQNLSVGGLFVRTSDPYDKGTLCVVNFSLDDGKRLIEGLARVVHQAGDGMGLEFIELDGESARVIEDVVTRQLQP